MDQNLLNINYSMDFCYRMASVPKSYEEAMASSDSHHFKKANDEEEIKARCVTKGYSHVKDLDYQETFNLDVDVSVSTRNICSPDGCENIFKCRLLQSDVSGNRLICKLNKSLYVLKQSGRIWNNYLDFLISQNFVKCVVDTCVYIKVDAKCKICSILIIWVDDIIIAARNVIILNDVKTVLPNKLKMKGLSQLSVFLGIEFKFENNCISMKQSKYIEKVLSKFKRSNCNHNVIPSVLSVNKLKYCDSKLLTDGKLYREIVGSLIYLMSCVRHVICFYVNFLSQYMKIFKGYYKL